MTLTSEAITNVEKLLQSGRKKDAITFLKETSKLSSREAKTVAKMVEEALQQHSSSRPSPYVATEMDRPLMAEAARFLLDKKDIIAAIRYIREHRQIAMSDCVNLLHETRDQYQPQYNRRGNRPIPFLGVGALILVPLSIGIILLLFASYTYLQQRKIVRNSQRVIGKVVEMDVAYRVGAAPIIEYNWNGQIRTHQSAIHSYPSPYYINEEVSLLVNRGNPEQVIIDTFTDRWSTFTILTLLGSGFLLASTVVSFINTRPKRNLS